MEGGRPTSALYNQYTQTKLDVWELSEILIKEKKRLNQLISVCFAIKRGLFA